MNNKEREELANKLFQLSLDNKSTCPGIMDIYHLIADFIIEREKEIRKDERIKVTEEICKWLHDKEWCKYLVTCSGCICIDEVILKANENTNEY